MIGSWKNLKIGNITKNLHLKKEKQKNVDEKFSENCNGKETILVSWADQKSKNNYQIGRN